MPIKKLYFRPWLPPLVIKKLLKNSDSRRITIVWKRFTVPNVPLETKG
jgi:hypothetical protein